MVNCSSSILINTAALKVNFANTYIPYSYYIVILLATIAELFKAV